MKEKQGEQQTQRQREARRQIQKERKKTKEGRGEDKMGREKKIEEARLGTDTCICGGTVSAVQSLGLRGTAGSAAGPFRVRWSEQLGHPLPKDWTQLTEHCGSRYPTCPGAKES